MIEYILFVLSGFHTLYFLVMLFLSQAPWYHYLYWPVSGVIFLFFGVILWEDSREWKRNRLGIPLPVRAGIAFSLGLYLLVTCAFALLLVFAKFYSSHDKWDYLILVESSGQTDTLTDEDLNMLDAAIGYVNSPGYEDCKLVLAAYNLKDLDGEYSQEIQYLMQDYLNEHGIPEERMIIRKISNSLRKNMINSYAYILVDWFVNDPMDNMVPRVAIMASELSCLRYHILLHNLGYHFDVFDYTEPLIFWPDRILTEMVETILCHMTNQFQYN